MLKNIGYFVFLVVALVLAKNLGKYLVKGALSSPSKLTYQDSLKLYLDAFPSIEDSLNQHPKMLDEITSFDSIKCSIDINEITYYHTLIKNRKQDFDLEAFNSAIKNQIDSSIRNNPKMAPQRRFNTKLSYVYYDKDGEYIFKITSEN